MSQETDLKLESVSLEFVPAVASTSSNLSINHFVNLFKSDALILRPAFQRNLVWNADQQSFLIDSILRGLPVPEIYVQTSTTADGEETTVVVDGQQRITSCLRFVSNELRLNSDLELDLRWRGRKFSELEPSLKKRFRSFELIVRKMPELGDAGLREIFRRLNKTVEALEAQELRHAAYTGPFIQLVEQIAAHSALNEAGVFSAKDYLRRRSDEFIAEVLHAVYLGAFPNKKDGLDDLFRTLEFSPAAEDSLQTLERRMGRVLEELTQIASTLRRTRFRNKSDFYSLVVFLARNAEALPMDPGAREDFLARLREFSGLVNEIKRREGTEAGIIDSDSERFGSDGVQYLRAVERAASDRLNRVRRNESLINVLSEPVMAGSPRPLESADSEWRVPASSDEESLVEDDDTIEGRVRAQQVLSAAEPRLDGGALVFEAEGPDAEATAPTP